MSAVKQLTAVCTIVAASMVTGAGVEEAEAAGYRQYYSSWGYRQSNGYHYRKYYYRPTPTQTTYKYHYCIHYPSRPRYVYYYNPVRRYYWGRLDLEGKPGEQYSLLKEDDRKEKLDDIPESAFPKPAAMPSIPESEDNEAIKPITDLPEPGDLPDGAKPE